MRSKDALYLVLDSNILKSRERELYTQTASGVIQRMAHKPSKSELPDPQRILSIFLFHQKNGLIPE